MNIILLNFQKLVNIKLQTMFLLTYIHKTVFTYEISNFVNFVKNHDIIILN